MQVFALFYTITMLKNAIAKLKQLGIESRDIFVVPIKGKNDHHNNPNIKFPHFRNAVDKGFAFATALSVITAGIGFKLFLGPIIWGIIGACCGFLIGFFSSYFRMNKRERNPKHMDLPLILIVNCPPDDVKKIESLLFETGALGVNTPLLKKN
ncbi:hypothetical protein [Tuberibacillus calidus]|jgi:hypothetical protein|uniref:hypothetical protein n=1 Tax=Tuberibacillus calidus TaxID=340097 RepID=UPI000413AB4E|nr:hypothetical protein [Tuberibacillus calidus]